MTSNTASPTIGCVDTSLGWSFQNCVIIYFAGYRYEACHCGSPDWKASRMSFWSLARRENARGYSLLAGESALASATWVQITSPYQSIDMFDGCLPFGEKMQIKLVSAHMKADMNAKIHNNMRENARMREKMRNFEKMKKCKSGVNFHQSGVNFRMLGPPKKNRSFLALCFAFSRANSVHDRALQVGIIGW